MLTRIMYPNKGSITVNGKVSSLIELGAGFHPDMSGRENIYINASILGIKREEIDKRIDEIIRFSELEEFIDNPIRTYSSGMYMRLAFSVAINVDADILLIDEILAVGDQAFQEKCIRKLDELRASGVTVVLVSHSMSQIKEIADRCIWIEGGKELMLLVIGFVLTIGSQIFLESRGVEFELKPTYYVISIMAIMGFDLLVRVKMNEMYPRIAGLFGTAYAGIVGVYFMFRPLQMLLERYVIWGRIIIGEPAVWLRFASMVMVWVIAGVAAHCVMWGWMKIKKKTACKKQAA